MAPRILFTAIMLIVLATSPFMSLANALQAESVIVTLEPSDGQTVTGIVILADAGKERTNVQVQITGAESGSSTMIHRGTCDAFDSTPVGLLGDPGAAGTIQSTVLVSFATLTDGNHVVAVHPDATDLTTTLACGEIPFAAEPPDLDSPTSTPTGFEPPEPDDPTSTPEPFEPPDPDSPTSTPTEVNPVDGRTYTSPSFGYSFSWDDSWGVEYVGTVDGADQLAITRLDSRLDFVGTRAYNGDIGACLDRVIQVLRELKNVAQVEPFTDESGQPISGEDADSVWIAHTYSLTTDSGSDPLRVQYSQCIRVDETAVLLMAQTTFEDVYADEAAAREAMMSTLSIPRQPPRPTAEPSPQPTAEPTDAPTAVPTLEPTLTPDSCAGVEGWVEATQVRINRLFELILDVSRADIFTIEEILSGARDEIEIMAEEQAQEPTPSPATKLQARFVELLRDEADLAQRQLDLYKTDPGNIPRQERLSQEATANIATLQEIDGQVAELRLTC